MKKIFLLHFIYINCFYSANQKNSIDECLLLKILSLKRRAGCPDRGVFNDPIGGGSSNPFFVKVGQYYIKDAKCGLLLNFNFKFHTESSIIKFLYENKRHIFHYCYENNISLKHISLRNSCIYSDQFKNDGECTFQKNIEELIKEDNAFFKYKIDEVKGVKKINIIGVNSKFAKPIFFLPYIHSPAWYAFDRLLKELFGSNNVSSIKVMKFFSSNNVAIMRAMGEYLKKSKEVLLGYCCLQHSKKTMLIHDISHEVFPLIIYGPIIKASELFIKYELGYNNYSGNISRSLMHEIEQSNRYKDVILLHHDLRSNEKEKLLCINAYIENANDFIRLMTPVNNIYLLEKHKECFYIFSIFAKNTILDIIDGKNTNRLKTVGACARIKIINTNVGISHEVFKEMFRQFYLCEILEQRELVNYFICEKKFIDMCRESMKQPGRFYNKDLLLKKIRQQCRLFLIRAFTAGLPQMSDGKYLKKYIKIFFDTLYEWNDKNDGAMAIEEEEFFTIICKKLFFRLYAINNICDYEEEDDASSIILRGEMRKWFIASCEKNCELMKKNVLVMPF